MKRKTIIPNYRIHHPALTILPRTNRLILNKPAWLMLVEKFERGESAYVRLFVDEGSGKENCFWLELCDERESGARRLDACSRHTRSFNLGGLTEMFGLGAYEKIRFPLTWDSEINAGKVDLSTRFPETNGAQDENTSRN